MTAPLTPERKDEIHQRFRWLLDAGRTPDRELNRDLFDDGGLAIRDLWDEVERLTRERDVLRAALQAEHRCDGYGPCRACDALGYT